jgi:hypothetical protein
MASAMGIPMHLTSETRLPLNPLSVGYVLFTVRYMPIKPAAHSPQTKPQLPAPPHTTHNTHNHLLHPTYMSHTPRHASLTPS